MPTRASRMRSTKPGAEKRSGATYSRLSSPETARSSASRLSAGSCWALTSATRPGATARSACTWSCMSETSGETTMASSPLISAGSW